MTATRSAGVLCVLGVLCGCAASSCSEGGLKPVPVDTRNDACASCRMAVSNARLAAEIVAAGEEPRVFDDIGCLSTYVRTHQLGSDVRLYVADHRTGALLDAESAVFTRAASIETPMGSHLVAHADDASREADGVRGPTVAAAQLFGPGR